MTQVTQAQAAPGPLIRAETAQFGRSALALCPDSVTPPGWSCRGFGNDSSCIVRRSSCRCATFRLQHTAFGCSPGYGLGLTLSGLQHVDGSPSLSVGLGLRREWKLLAHQRRCCCWGSRQQSIRPLATGSPVGRSYALGSSRSGRSLGSRRKLPARRPRAQTPQSSTCRPKGLRSRHRTLH